MYVMLAALFAGSLTISAQERKCEGQKEKRQPPTAEERIKFEVSQMSRRLMLDDATTAKFMPVYEKYLTELDACREVGKPKDKAQEAAPAPAPEGAPAPECGGPGMPDLTDAEIAELLKMQFEQKRKLLDIREKYYAEFSKLLTQKQILQIYHPKKDRSEWRHKRESKPRSCSSDFGPRQE